MWKIIVLFVLAALVFSLIVRFPAFFICVAVIFIAGCIAYFVKKKDNTKNNTAEAGGDIPASQSASAGKPDVITDEDRNDYILPHNEDKDRFSDGGIDAAKHEEPCSFFVKKYDSSIDDSKYKELCSIYEEYKAESVLEKRISIGKKIIDLLNGCSPKVASMIQVNDLFRPSYRYSPITIAELLEDIKRDIRSNTYLLNTWNEYKAEVDGIQRCQIKFDYETVLEPRRLMDIPEIKYSPVGAAFTFDRIPAFVSLAVNTTGEKASKDKILGISAILYEDLMPVSAFSVDLRKSGVSLSHVASDFLEFIGKLPLVGYNLPNDLNFLWAAGIDVTAQKRKYYDVWYVCDKALGKYLTDHTLKSACFECGIHRPPMDEQGISDCVATVKVFEKSLKYIK